MRGWGLLRALALQDATKGNSLPANKQSIFTTVSVVVVVVFFPAGAATAAAKAKREVDIAKRIF